MGKQGLNEIKDVNFWINLMTMIFIPLLSIVLLLIYSYFERRDRDGRKERGEGY